jgi:N-hydroxyarylamine O-acetyltransferase
LSASLNDSQLYERYLEILGVEPSPPSIAGLEELVSAQMLRIPFENISKLYYLKRDGLRNIPGFEQYLDGIERYHFGGTCYSNNHYFNQLLTHLGYRAMLCGADMNNPDVHLVNIVEVDGREYLVDTGYAAPFLKPMPRDLTEDMEIRRGRDRYVLRPQDTKGCSRMDLYRDGELMHGYTAKPIARSIDYFSRTIEGSFRDEATFMNSLLLVKFFERRSFAVYNMSAIESKGETYTTRTLADRSELSQVIVENFGMDEEVVAEALSVLREFGNAWD